MSIGRDRFDEAEEEALTRVLREEELWPYSGGGFAPEMQSAFELVQQHFSKAGQTAFMVPTSSGTSSIQVALGGLQIKPGTEVIVTAITDPGSVTPILFHNCIPIFADVHPDTGLITPDTVRAKLTRRTSAVIAVHLTGSPVDIAGIRKMLDQEGRGEIKIIEDVAQGLGASLDGTPLGMLGDAGCFSLNAHKHVTVGEGGFVLLRNETDRHRCHNFADKHRNRFRQDENSEHGAYKGPGHSLRMSELQGAMLAAQMPKLMTFAGKRTELGLAVEKRLSETSDLVTMAHLDKAVPSFFGLMFRTRANVDWGKKEVAVDEVKSRLQDIKTSISTGYTAYGRQTAERLPIYLYPLFQAPRNLSGIPGDLWPAEVIAEKRDKSDGQAQHYNYDNHYQAGDCPNTETYMNRMFWLRIHEGYTLEHAERIADTIVDVFVEADIAERA